nr:Gldg family protein [uncultured Acetatifactor sp.]
MFAIYKRELKAYFRSFIGLLFIAVTLFFIGLYYTVYNLLNGYPYFAYTMSSVIFLFMLSVPILSMRILAEEKRSKSDQLILTAPVSVGGIVMGKFLALVTIFLIPTLISCIYPLLMSSYGSVPMGEAYISILGFFLFGVTSIAIGVFISSLTESQVIAAVLSFATLFLGYMMSSICSIISSTGNLLTTVLGCFDMYTPFANLLEGTLNIGSIVYFVSITALALFLTVQSIQKRRYSVSVKNFSFSAYSTGMIAIAVAIVVAANLVIGEMPSSWTAIDLTSEKLYSLTDQTIEFVNNMQEDVTIYAIVNEDSQDTTLGQTLRRYDDLSDHITVEYVDPTVNPRFHTQYTDSAISINSLIVVSDKRNRVIDYSDIYESSFDYSTYTSTTTGYDGEGQITSALDYVLSDDLPKVYMTEGHGEYTLSGSFTDALTKENVEYETINLMDYDAVPEDTACVIINGPQSDFSSDDTEKVISYLESGGKVILITG